MSKLHIGQIKANIEELFHDKVDLSDIADNDPEKETKSLTRYLAAYAIYYLSNCSETDAGLSVTDGYDDGGIDAIYYSEQAEKLFIVQSKWRKDGKGEIKKDEILKFQEGIDNLFNLDFDSFNERIKIKQEYIDKALQKPGIKIEIIIIDTCERNEISPRNTKTFFKYISELNENGDNKAEPRVEFIRLNQSEIHKSLLRKNDNIDIMIGLKDWGDTSIENNEIQCKAYYGCVSASEVANWWEFFGDRLFNNNIRKVLGKTDVNNEIEKTLQEQPDLFWYFNNGITAVADNIKKTIVGGDSREIGTFELKNFTIINGAQTVSSIGKFKKKDLDGSLLNQAQVMLRIIDINNNAELIKQITKANNRQNKVEGIDFASQDPEQKRLREELILEKIDYVIIRSEDFEPDEKSFNIYEATAALASINSDVSLAVQAKSAIGAFFDNLDKGIYKKIFNKSISGYYAYNAVSFAREVEKILEEKVRDLNKKSGIEYGVLIHGNRMIIHLLSNKNNIHNFLFSKDFNIDYHKLKKDLDEILNDIKNFIKNKYPNSILATLFKNKTKCQELRDYILRT